VGRPEPVCRRWPRWRRGVRDADAGGRNLAYTVPAFERAEKREVRDRRPTVLLSDPDVLHYGLLPHGHRLRGWLFGSLEFGVDVSRLSTPAHPQTDAPTVFVYDGSPGGVGLARGSYDRIDALVARAGRLIDDCGCADGCPACIQSPHCGNANEPLAPAVVLLEAPSDAGTG
jgi:ATP-dependent helicase YprA (DUF1998 family)